MLLLLLLLRFSLEDFLGFCFLFLQAFGSQANLAGQGASQPALGLSNKQIEESGSNSMPDFGIESKVNAIISKPTELHGFISFCSIRMKFRNQKYEEI